GKDLDADVLVLDPHGLGDDRHREDPLEGRLPLLAVVELAHLAAVDLEQDVGAVGDDAVVGPGADVDALDQFGRVADLEDLALAGLVDGDAIAAGGERLARAVLVPDPAQVGAAHRDVGLVAPDEALVLHGAAELHPGVGLRAEDAEAEPEVEVADRPALPDDELI